MLPPNLPQVRPVLLDLQWPPATHGYQTLEIWLVQIKIFPDSVRFRGHEGQRGEGYARLSRSLGCRQALGSPPSPPVQKH